MARKTSEWVLDQSQPEASLEAKMRKLRLSCFGAHHEKARFDRKDRNVEKRGRQQEKRKIKYEMG